MLGDGQTSLRGGYGLYYNTNNQQNLIVTVTNPPFTPRPVHRQPDLPAAPNFAELGALSIRPYQCDIETPRVHVWNVNVQRELVPRARSLTLGYAGSRGQKLLRNTDVNVPVPADARRRYARSTPRRPRARTRASRSIEHKTSDGHSWYDALVVELRRPRGAA